MTSSLDLSISEVPMRELVLCAFVLVAGCGESPEPTDDAGAREDGAVLDDAATVVDAYTPDGGGEGVLCARESSEMLDGARIVVCEEAFDVAPLVRPPSDWDADGARFVHGGIERREGGGLAFVGRGVHYDIASPAPEWVEAESAFGEVRYGHLLYAARVRDGAVEALAPVARIDDRVFQRLLAGRILEGGVSAREMDAEGEVRWAFDDHSTPLRIRLEEAPDEAPVDASARFPRYALRGRIENASTSVRGSDDACLPALSALGDADPFATAVDDVVVVLRHPSMHGSFDDVFTMDWPTGTTVGNNMGGGLFVSVAALIQSEAPSPTEAGSHPHGVPWGGPSTELEVVTGGGEPCTP